MPFLQQGSDATITIPAAQFVRIGALQGATTTITIPMGQPGGPVATVTDNQQLFGPYPNGATVSVFATKGVTEYWVGAAPVLTSQFNRYASIRAAMEAANRTNIFSQPPLLPAPTWQATTVYYGSAVVRGAGAAAGNLYLCVGSSTSEGSASGTSAATVGPTGTLPTVQIDGTVAWHYIGKATSTGTYPLFSTIKPVVSTDVMNGFAAITSPNNYAAMGLASVQPSATAPVIQLANGVLSNAITYVPKNAGTVAAPARNSNGIYGVARFITNCNKWLCLQSQAPIYQFGKAIQIIVNGRRVSEAPLTFTDATTNPGCFIFDMSVFDTGNKTVELHFVDSPSNFVFRLAVGDQEYIYPAANPNSFKIALEGDSICDNTYIAGTHYENRTERLIGEFLGCKNVYNNSIGGTGGSNSGSKTVWLERLPDIVAFAPDILIIDGGHNDVVNTQAQRLAAYSAYLTAARVALPYCTIVVFGGNLLGSETLAAQIVTENDLLTAFNGFADKNSVFIPVFTANPPMLPATATAGFNFQQSNAAPYTNSHPTGWYNRHMMQVLANGIRAFFGVQ